MEVSGPGRFLWSDGMTVLYCAPILLGGPEHGTSVSVAVRAT